MAEIHSFGGQADATFRFYSFSVAIQKGKMLQ